MIEFNVLEASSECAVIKMVGILNEDANLGSFLVPMADRLEINLSDLKSINSLGIRIFTRWAYDLKHAQLIFTHCPKVFIDQVNMIAKFLPARALIQSFYVPYYSEALEEEKFILFQAGENFKNHPSNGMSIHPSVVKDQNGNIMDIDVVPEKYFSFLKSHGAQN